MLHVAVEILRVLSAPSLAQLWPRLPFLVRYSEPFFVNPHPLIKGPTSRYVRRKNILSHLSSRTFAWSCSLRSERVEAGPSRNHSAEKLTPRCSSFRVWRRQPLLRLVCYAARPENGRTGTDCKSGTHALDTIALVGNERLFWFFELVCTPQPR
jgi:hypothetical protein